MQTNLDYFIVWLVVILIIFSIALWPTKILRIIIWNYIISFLVVGLYLFMEMISYRLNNWTINMTLGSEQSVQNIMINEKQTIGLFFYLILLVIFVNKSRVEWWSYEDRWLYNWLLIFWPLTAISIMTTLIVVILWTDVMSYKEVVAFSNQFSKGSMINWFIQNLPIWIILPWLAILFWSMDLPIFRKRVVVTSS